MRRGPYNPVPFRDGCKIVRIYEVPFTDSVGNRAVITKVDFFDKKGREILAYTLRVKWVGG